MNITLTDGQEQARQEILSALGKVHMLKGVEHVLRGFAGTGKTTLMQVVVADMVIFLQEAEASVVLAVAILVVVEQVEVGKTKSCLRCKHLQIVQFLIITVQTQ